ncbi:MAG: hypothetical protein RO009_08385 [Pseudorhodoplanes sp.]|nr:hypothetical protein [Pseudorhodoplanes sp.]
MQSSEPRGPLIFLLIFSVLCMLGSLYGVVRGLQGGWPVFAFSALGAVIFAARLWPGRNADCADALLQRFPGPVELRADRRKLFLGLIAVIVLAGLFLSSPTPKRVDPTIQLLLGLGFGATIPFGILALIKWPKLRLDANGFYVIAWRSSYARWEGASSFRVATIGHVLYNDEKLGNGSALPDVYAFSPSELASLMNRWRERALQAKS